MMKEKSMAISTEAISKAINAVRTGLVTHDHGNVFLVKGKGGVYRTYVSDKGAACSCKWGREFRQWGWERPCWHILAAAGVADIDVPLTSEERGKHEAV
jgi:hypothetical protein